MTKLEQAALTTTPLPAAIVEDIYTGAQLGMVAQIRGLCESHERLRAELLGAEKIIAELRAEKGTADLDQRFF